MKKSRTAPCGYPNNITPKRKQGILYLHIKYLGRSDSSVPKCPKIHRKAHVPIKRETLVLLCEFCETFLNSFFTEHSDCF